MTDDISFPCKAACDKAGMDCPLYNAWEEHRLKAQELLGKVNDVHAKVNGLHGAMEELMHFGAHLQHLDKLPIILDRTLDAALRTNHTDNKTVMFIVKIMGGVILALTFVIVALLTGAHLGWLSLK